MNERIEIFARAAGYDPITKAAMKALGFDPEKFAELIVQECADTVLGFHNQFGDSAHAEIREHFGIE